MPAPAPDALDSYSPATGERLGSVAATPPGTVAALVDDVAEVQPFWAELPLSDRARYMRRTAQVLIDHLDDSARLIAREQGKPVTECVTTELLPIIAALHWIAEHGQRVLAAARRPARPLLEPRRERLAYEPLGVVAVVTPWSQPWSTPLAQAAVALMCGNGVVLKPSSQTPLCGQRIQATFERAGLPEGLLRTVHGRAEVGQAVVESPPVAKVFFTGSVAAGRAIAAACAERLKGSRLELGGKGPALVLADATLDAAVAGCAWGAFANAGQGHGAIDRIYVAHELAEPFVDGLVAAARALRVGDPLKPRTEIGPLVAPERLERVRELVDEALAGGAELRCGGPIEVAGLAGGFYAPAVLTGATQAMGILGEGVVAPVVPVVVVDDDEQAIVLANEARVGPGASVWTRDRERGRRIAARIGSGTVSINEHPGLQAPFETSWSGAAGSARRRSHVELWFRECVDVKRLSWDRVRIRPPWRPPYDEALGRAASSAAQLLYGRDDDKLAALRRGALPLARVGRRMARGALRR